MDFMECCKQRFKQYNTVLCMGMDPVIEKIPVGDKSKIEKTITDFYISLLENFHKMTLAIKPNIAFYEQYGLDGIKALKNIISKAEELEVPVILDAKRGDIGNTAKAYAKAAFDELKADAVTLSPYLGEDSLTPFFEYSDKGFFILDRTSNKGGSDFQSLKIDKREELFIEVANKIVWWNKKYSNSIGAVAGATHLEELKRISSIFAKNDFLPILIPGVGRQGGSLEEVMNILRSYNYPLFKVFINSSSKINYAYLDHPGKDYLEASSIEINKMLLDNIN